MMKKIVLFLVLFGFSQTILALTCTGNVTKIETLSGGLVRLVSSSGLPTKSYVCSINGNWKNITTEVCQAWVSSASLAQASGQKIEMVYTNTTVTRCSSLPVNSSSIPPYSVGVKK